MSVIAMLQGESEADAGTLQTALTLARRLGVPIKGLCALPDPASGVMLVASEVQGMTAELAQNLVDMQADMIADAKASFEDAVRIGGQDLDCEFIHRVAIAEHAGANAATLSDAVVYHRSAALSNGSLHAGFDHVLMTARLPVILSGTQDMTDGPVVIGWDGSNGAARSVRFHLPLIRAFGKVLIAHQKKDSERDGNRLVAAPEALRSWLSARGVKAQVCEIEGDVAGGLLAMAMGVEASMIVVGAYGHSRLGERMFGGTSRHLLRADAAPALALAR